LTELTNAAGLFCKSGIKGPIPKGFLKNNRKLTSTIVMFAESKITGLNPLFLDDNDEASGTYKITSVSGMFSSCTSLTGNIPERLFDGCTTITSAAGVYDYSSLTNVSKYTAYGLFYNTDIRSVPI